MEDLDIAAERTEIERESLVAAIRRRPSEGLLPGGECHVCGEVLDLPRLFCGLECAEAHRRRSGLSGFARLRREPSR